MLWRSCWSFPWCRFYGRSSRQKPGRAHLRGWAPALLHSEARVTSPPFRAALAPRSVRRLPIGRRHCALRSRRQPRAGGSCGAARRLTGSRSQHRPPLFKRLGDAPFVRGAAALAHYPHSDRIRVCQDRFCRTKPPGSTRVSRGSPAARLLAAGVDGPATAIACPPLLLGPSRRLS